MDPLGFLASVWVDTAFSLPREGKLSSLDKGRKGVNQTWSNHHGPTEPPEAGLPEP